MSKTETAAAGGKREVARLSDPSSSISILLDFKNFRDDPFSVFAGKILLCCETNAFLVPPKEVTDPLVAARLDYDTKLIKAKATGGAGGATEFKDIAKEVCAVKLEDVAKWVSENCQGSRAVAMSYGFKVVSETRTRATQPPQPRNVRHKYGMPGTIVFACDTLGARMRYIVSCTQDATKTFTMCGESTDSRKIVAQGLERGKAYTFSVFGRNTAGDGLPYTTAEIIAAV